MKTLILALLISACSQADQPKAPDAVPTPEIQQAATPASSPAPKKKPDEKAKKSSHTDKKKDPPTKEKPSKK